MKGVFKLSQRRPSPIVHVKIVFKGKYLLRGARKRK